MIRSVADSLSVEIPFLSIMQYPTVREFARFVDELLDETKTVSAVQNAQE
jgi:hypothetical protein